MMSRLPDEYDRIHTDLLPFHALSPRDLQTKLTVHRRCQIPMCSVRQRLDPHVCDILDARGARADHRMEGQASLLQPVARWLGDLTAVYSVHDTAQVLLSWNHRQELMEHIEEDECRWGQSPDREGSHTELPDLEEDDEIDTTPSGCRRSAALGRR